MDVKDADARQAAEEPAAAAAEVSPRDFGGMMRRARERKGISLRQIAIATKISASALEALERNDVSRLPGGIFSRAFVRSYAVEVGLDPERTVRDFIERFPSEVAGHSTQHKRESQQAEALKSQREVAGVAMKLIGISVPVAALLVYFTFGGANSRPSSDGPGGPAGELPAAPAAAAVDREPSLGAPVETPPLASESPASPAGVAAVAEPEPDVLQIAIRVTGPCWVSIVSDGRQTIGRVMNAGEQLVERVQNEMELQVGDAGNFTFTINDVAGRPLGSGGQVVSARINRANYQTFLRP